MSYRGIALLVDTGSQVSVLTPQVYEALPEKFKSMRETGVSLRAVNGSPFPVKGTVVLPLAVSSVVSNEAFLVADIGQSFDVDGILGVDILRAHKGQIDLENDQVRYDGVWTPCQVASGTDVVTFEGVTIEPGCVSSITVTLPSSVSPVSLIKPLIEFETENELLVAQCMVDRGTREISLTTINRGEKEVTIPPGQIVAHLEPLTPDDEKGVSCNALNADEQVELPEYLLDMYQRSCVHLDPDQSKRQTVIARVRGGCL